MRSADPSVNSANAPKHVVQCGCRRPAEILANPAMPIGLSRRPMELSALTFVITTHEADTLGLAVICPDARYASVELAGVKRLIRRHASPAQWKEIERLIASGVDTGPMTSGVFHAVLSGRLTV